MKKNYIKLLITIFIVLLCELTVEIHLFKISLNYCKSVKQALENLIMSLEISILKDYTNQIF